MSPTNDNCTDLVREVWEATVDELGSVCHIILGQMILHVMIFNITVGTDGNLCALESWILIDVYILCV